MIPRQQAKGGTLNDSASNRDAGLSKLPEDQLLTGKPVLHHLGFVVASIQDVADEFARCMSASWDGRVIDDPLQRVRIALFQPSENLNPVLELMEPAGADSTVGDFLDRGGGLHHVCYEVDDLDSSLLEALRLGLTTVGPPAPSFAFAGRRIAKVSSRTLLLMELLERHRA